MVLTIYRFARWCYLHHVPLIPQALKGLLLVVFHCYLPPQCVIGKGTKLWHEGFGTMIHDDVEIGENCNIYNYVAIGGGYDGPNGPPLRIIIGNNVNVGHGAKVFCKGGTLRIGDGATIGACSVVFHDVPANMVAIGIPARCRPKHMPQEPHQAEEIGAAART